MSLDTKSSFYFGHVVNDLNFQIDFKEITNELTANLNVGDYTPESLALEIARAMNDASETPFVYTATFDRVNRAYTISSTGNFELLITTGSHLGTSSFTLLGYSGADLTGTNTYTANNLSGNIYRPQFKLQRYIGPDDLQESVDVAINESASGKIEIVTYGTVKKAEFTIEWITNIFQSYSSPIENNSTGLENARTFLQSITKKTIFQFMPDRDNQNFYYDVILSDIGSSKEGTGYRLVEQYSKNLPNYYNTELVTLRVVI